MVIVVIDESQERFPTLLPAVRNQDRPQNKMDPGSGSKQPSGTRKKPVVSRENRSNTNQKVVKARPSNENPPKPDSRMKKLRIIRQRLIKTRAEKKETSESSDEEVTPQPKWKEFVPRPLTPETMNNLCSRLERLMEGHEGTKERILIIDSAMKALLRSMDTLSKSSGQALSQCDPIILKVKEIEKQKERIDRRLSVLKDFTKRHEDDLVSMRDHLKIKLSQIK